MIKWLVSHLFIDSMSLTTHEVLPWLMPSGEILQIWPVQIAWNQYFLSRVAASNWWLWIWVQGKMCTKNISVSVAFKVFFFTKRIDWKRLHCSQCSVEKKLKIESCLLSWRLLFEVKVEVEVSPLTDQKQLSQIKFWYATSREQQKTSSNNGVIKTTQR